MWPFDQPRNCATFTTRHVIQDRKPIVRVVHDETDRSWQFLSDDGADMNVALLVCLSEVVAHDKTVLDVADLPPGWVATRACAGANWSRMPQYADALRVFVDWSRIKNTDEFFDSVFTQCRSPSWHGRNLDALADSWIAGNINEHDPPYIFVFDSLGQTPIDLIEFRDSVLQIVRESIDENGGRLQTANEQSGAPKSPIGRELES